MNEAQAPTPIVVPANIGLAIVRRLEEAGTPATPENYTKTYCDLTGAAPPSNNECEELVKALRGLLERAANQAEGLATRLGTSNTELKDTVRNLGAAREKTEVLRLLGNIVSKATHMSETVESSRTELVATRVAMERMEEELRETKQMLHEDPLTGAMNRRAMDQVLAREVSRVRRTSGKLSLSMIDIDHFKKINDAYGHDCGDKVLAHLTLVVRSVLRETDVLVRYGGEEFLLVLPDTDVRGAQFVMGRLQTVVRKSPFAYESRLIPFTFSAGIAELTPEENGQALVMRADKALYAAKHAGRNCIKLAGQ